MVNLSTNNLVINYFVGKPVDNYWWFKFVNKLTTKFFVAKIIDDKVFINNLLSVFYVFL